MNRLLISLAVLLSLASCRSVPPTLEVVGPRVARLTADLDSTYEYVPRAGARMGYEWNEVRREMGQVLLRTPPEQAFFTMVGEQVRFEEATVRLREVRGRVELHVDATLVHGPPGGPFQRKERVGMDWYEEFFAAVEAEAEAAASAETEVDTESGADSSGDDDAPSPES